MSLKRSLPIAVALAFIALCAFFFNGVLDEMPESYKTKRW